ncbi:hypothetical protein [Desulfoprunum benzoelyticum]|uniref:hypothetical protein n=1 Tax=Desulfoprunum benzoelyticum TaxID=1506996 RepID=UPI001612B85F|nr:hypothetical protein [Desulfoprunum benzoelyticum]
MNQKLMTGDAVTLSQAVALQRRRQILSRRPRTGTVEIIGVIDTDQNSHHTEASCHNLSPLVHDRNENRILKNKRQKRRKISSDNIWIHIVFVPHIADISITNLIEIQHGLY